MFLAVEVTRAVFHNKGLRGTKLRESGRDRETKCGSGRVGRNGGWFGTHTLIMTKSMN